MKSWNEIGHFEIYNSSTRKYVPNLALDARLTAHPYRITGQLFFDASHKPCKNGKGPNPKRISIWEIHPAYAIDVCSNSTLASCKATDDSLWTPLDQWLSTEEASIRRIPSISAHKSGRK